MLRNEFKIAGAFILLTVLLAALDFWRPIEELVFNSTRVLGTIRQQLHNLTTLCLGVLAITLVDKVLLPWFRIEDICRNRNGWNDSPPAVRAAAIIGWFIMAAAVLLSVTQGVIAL